MNSFCENWTDIEGYEGIYQVNDLGQVRSVDRIVMKGGFKHKQKGKLLKPTSFTYRKRVYNLWKDDSYKRVKITINQ